MSGSDGQSATAAAAQTPAVQQQVQKLKQTDANVRQHEAAHQSAGGGHAGAASFTYTRGPDGKSYATAGEVQVDISAEGEAAATVAKMEQVKAAALAPNDPSPQDLRVAAQADALKLKAQSELRKSGGDSGRAESGSDATNDGGDATSKDGVGHSQPRQGNTGRSGQTGQASPALAARGTAAYGVAQSLGGSLPFAAAGSGGLGGGLVV